MGALGLILGRAGSKGLPGKNLRPIAGRPCVEWTIRCALEAEHSGALERVVLSTDSRDMRRLGAEAGIECVERPPELAGDGATIDDAARHALREIGDGTLDPVVILYANVPVRPERVVERAIDCLSESGADSVQSYQPVGKHHPWWTAVVGADGSVRPWEGGVLNHGVYRRQDLPQAHIPDGAVLAVRRAALMLETPGVEPGPHAFLGARRAGFVNEPGSVVDIDSELDARIAEAVLLEHAGAGS